MSKRVFPFSSPMSRRSLTFLGSGYIHNKRKIDCKNARELVMF